MSPPPFTLAIALGANLPSFEGDPESTLIAIRPRIQNIIREWTSSNVQKITPEYKNNREFRWRWSPLFETEAVGGPKDQNPYINAVLVVDGKTLQSIKPSEKAALELLEKFLSLEKQYGRNRELDSIRWGPRTLDIDLLAWGDLQVQNKILTIPHPRLIERNFVVVPLAAALSYQEDTTKKIINADWPESKT
tara:strand:- start:179 stop:754 length:576 start_codon:yes stop_codon:yes gene_type:complete